jgi:hypothetical protein
VGLGREVDDRVTAGERLTNGLLVGDVGLHEATAATVDQILDRLDAPCVGELVEHHDLVAGVVLQNLTREVGADEAGTAGDEQPHARAPVCARSAR